jgi:hypothetical protein
MVPNVPGLVANGDIKYFMVPDWSNVVYPPYPVGSDGIVNPVLAANNVNDRAASFVADPFIFYENGVWYMFFEVGSTVGEDIGLATSSDGFNWTYQQIVLDDSFHLAYPLVFKWNGRYYMTPDSSSTNSVMLYEASEFPYNWTYVTALVNGKAFVDPTLFHFDDLWWMFVGDKSNRECYLYYSTNLTDSKSWIQHPSSPIISGDGSKARPGGRTVVFDTDKILRFTQKCDVGYGEAVRAFQVDVLNTTSYVEHEIEGGSPVIAKSGYGWNQYGMHTFDPWWAGDRWLAAVDGRGTGTRSVGIYVGSTTSPPEPGECNLAICSLPSGVTFSVEGMSHVTPWSGTYKENTSVRLVMPETYVTGEAGYYWDRWDNGAKNQSITVTINTNINLYALFTGPYYKLTVASLPASGVTFALNGTNQVTPYSKWLIEGSYSLVMPETHDGDAWNQWLEDGDANRTKTITLPTATWTGLFVKPPAAEFTFSPAVLWVNETATFNASATHSQPNITSYEWNFNDGSVLRTKEPVTKHVYDKEGRCVVTLNVTDGNGLWNITAKRITITFRTDLNKDGIVNILDISRVASAYGRRPGDAGWDASADLDKNEIINIVDLVKVSVDYRKTL